MKNFIYALRGIKKGLSEGPIIIYIIILSIFGLLLGWYLKFNHIKFAILIMGIGLSIALEFMNSAIESTIDAHETRQEKFEDAKDISSGSVLIFGIFSIFVGLMLIF